MSSLKDITSRLAMLHAIAAWAKEQEAVCRGMANDKLLELHDETGARSAAVSVGGVNVGTFSVSESKPRIAVADNAEYQAWLRDLHEDGDARVIAHTSYDFPGFEKSLEVVNGNVIDPKTGEVVPGLEYVPGGATLGTRLSGCGIDDVRCAMASAGIGATDVLAAGEGVGLALEGGDE